MKNENGFRNFEVKKGPRSDSNAVEEMDNIVPLQMTQEEEDEEERLRDKGGVEVGERYVPVKKRGVVVGMEKIPGEIKRAAPEAASHDLNPEEALIAKEEMQLSGEEVGDAVRELTGPGEVEKEEGETDYGMFEPKEEPTAMVGSSEKIGVRREAALNNGQEYTGTSSDKLRGKSKKSKLKDRRQAESIF